MNGAPTPHRLERIPRRLPQNLVSGLARVPVCNVFKADATFLALQFKPDNAGGPGRGNKTVNLISDSPLISRDLKTMTANSTAGKVAKALRQLGKMLEMTPKRTTSHSKGGGSKGSKREPLPNSPPTLRDLGVPKKVSMLAQQIYEN